MSSLQLCPTGGSAQRGDPSAQAPLPNPTTNTSWERRSCLSGMLCIQTLLCIFPTGTGRYIHEEQADLSSAPEPLLCPRAGAASLSCCFMGLPSSSFTQHAVTRGVGPAPGNQRCLPEEWQMFGKRQRLGKDCFPVLAMQEEDPQGKHRAGIQLGDETSPSLATGTQYQPA